MAKQCFDRLSDDHIAPLIRLIEVWRSEGNDVPYPDPLDGGIDAKVLFLLESPGPKAIKMGFISRDNPDQTAQNIGQALSDAGITRFDSVLWNVVPFHVATAAKNKNASQSQVKSSAYYTQQFIDLLPELQAVVFCGDTALTAMKFLDIRCRVFATYHPSAKVFNRKDYRDHIQATFAEVKRHIAG